MAKRRIRAVANLRRSLERFAAKEVVEKVLQGSDRLGEASDPSQIALWVQRAMERLDRAADKTTRTRIMEECGYACAKANHGTIDRVVAKRKKYGSLEEFLEAEKDSVLPGMRLEKKGRALYQYYMPRSFGPNRRCFCSLLSGLPPEKTISPTYCQCSKGFARRMWERVLGKPVKVEVLETALTGADECKFRIYL
jgi:hypothetical protein